MGQRIVDNINDDGVRQVLDKLVIELQSRHSQSKISRLPTTLQPENLIFGFEPGTVEQMLKRMDQNNDGVLDRREVGFKNNTGFRNRTAQP